jgi:lipopolysaccharide assembly outer membrane protein LptD (OstA)
VKKNQLIYLFFTIIIFSLPIHSAAQISDSLNTETSHSYDSLNVVLPFDSTKVDSIQSDSTESGEASAQLEGPIKYYADVVQVSRDKNRIYLEGNAKVVYQNMTLDAAKILINQDDRTLYAEGVSDTTDSLGNPIYTGTPIFTESGREPMTGNTLLYNFYTKRGKISYGKTKMPPGFYRGENVHKISKNTLLVEDGYFTSCEYIDEPHFYFRSPKMRVEVQEKVVARPVYLYIADVPLFVLPFGVFPNKKGRHSGLMIPSYGESAYGGRFLKGIGYYWAPNDYIDATFATDYYDKLGFTYNADLSYVVRYLLNGRIFGFYFPRDPNRPDLRNRWAVQFSHSQTIDPTLRLAASGKFQSDGELARDYAADYNRRVDQILSSNITLSKKWPGTKNSLQLSLSRTQNLQTGSTNYMAPNLRFSRSQSSIYETITGNTVLGKKEWYQTINFSYNGRALNQGFSRKPPDGEPESGDSRGVEHNLTFNAPQKIFKYLNISPALSYQEIWVGETTEAYYDPDSNETVTEQVDGFAVRRTFRGSIGLNTILFGLFEPNIGSLKFIRHKMDPKISFQFTPDFSNPSYGYFTYVKDSSGNEDKIDRFGGPGNPFGSTPTRRSQTMQMSLGNLFQAKFVDGEKETKMDLFRLNFSSSYDFLADEFKLKPLRSDFRSTPLKGVNLTISSVHDFYKLQDDERIDELRFPRLTNLNGNLGFSIDQNTLSRLWEEEKEKTDGDGEATRETEEDDLVQDEYLYQEEVSDEFAAKRITIPWRLNLGFNYNRDVQADRNRFNVKAALNVSITKKWRINYTATYDAVTGDLAYQSISIYRDLHCWEMSFNWQPTVDYYSFRINVKANILQDLKLTKHPSGSTRNVGY